jgi:uncharacterized protein (DUF4415 family)
VTKNDAHISRFTTDELARLRESGSDLTDWARVDALTEEELEASIDHDEEGEIDWNSVQVGFPGPKQQLTVRFDVDVIEWFKAQGPGYQTRMNAVLRSYVGAQKRR